MFTPATIRRRRRAAVTTGAVLAVGLVLSGCTGSSTSSAGAVEMWAAAPPDQSQEATIRATYDGFTETHPGTEVNITFMPADAVADKQRTALAAGQGPSIVGAAGPSTVGPYAEAGYLADLTDLVKENGLDNKIFPWALQAGTVDGKVVALPSAYESLVLFYNKTLFEEHGWQPPTDRASLEALANEMVDEGVIPFAGGNADYRAVVEITLSALLNQVAGPGYIHDALLGDASWADEPCVESTTTMVDYFGKGWIGGGTEKYFTKGFGAVYQDFASGAAGMFISGSYDFTQLPAYFGADGNTSEWDWVPLPPLSDDVPANVYALAVGGTASVNAQLSDTEPAKSFLAWLYTNDNAAWADVAAGVDGATPLPIDFDPSQVPDNVDPRIVEHYTQINEASAESMVGYVTYTSFGPKSEAFVVTNTEKLITDDMTPADFCGGLESASQEDIASGDVPSVWATDAR
ncbi:MAG TPA: extracellular solute-binding protein [Plantibacter sp.]|uniref:ABC transporter substrate-binding protein n=1 Tax=unclassified Plantibacter TaxID=2624265 RepID=UPI002BE34FD1|nr:extracellular solute-binding protein [Plantibacter sp.]